MWLIQITVYKSSALTGKVYVFRGMLKDLLPYKVQGSLLLALSQDQSSIGNQLWFLHPCKATAYKCCISTCL